MGTPGILGAIVERTLTDVKTRKANVSRRDLEQRARLRTGRRRTWENTLRRTATDPIRFITEIKKASPSRGVLRADLDAASLAAAYREHGAAAISVVTEPHFFQGSDAFLEAARRESGPLPLLRKDFHVHELQLLEAAAGEADAALLIAAVLSPTQLKDFLDIAGAFALGHLVEVADVREAEMALRAGASVLGVNNRDLTTFEVDPDRTRIVLPILREANIVSVAESGIHDRETVVRYQEWGLHALLVGEALIVAQDPGVMLRKLRGVST
jgi:indole-3-glycerol phosphate synthase